MMERKHRSGDTDGDTGDEVPASLNSSMSRPVFNAKVYTNSLNSARKVVLERGFK